MNMTVVDIVQIRAELTEQINRVRRAAEIGATTWMQADQLAYRAEHVWRTTYPNLAKLLDTTTPIND